MSALYRTHRPQDFGQVVGQAHVVQTLRNAVELDRVAHAYLFAGPRGTGKTSMAKILAKSINCEQGPTVTPCLVCESCRSIHDATAIDVIEMDAASHRGIDDIREIRDRVALRPARGRMKVYIVDEAHMLTKEASNAVLKTLEEPPDHVVFVLCTTELQAMLPTIRSRCQRFVFQRPGLGEISEVLRRIATAEGIEIDDAAVQLVARAAGGSFRDGVTILDQLSTAQSAAIGAEDVRTLLGTADEASLFGAIDLVGAGDAAGLLRLVDDLVESGTDLASFTTGLLGHLRGLFLTQQLGQPPLDLGLSDHEQERMREQAEAVSPRAVVRLIDLLRTVVDDVKEGGDPRLPLELALVKVSRPANELALEALDQRLERLESNGASPAPPKPSPAAAPPPPVTAAAPAPPTVAQPAPPAEPEPGPEPEPQAAAAPVATAVAEPATLEQVSARWSEAIVPEIGRRSVPLHSLVQSARPVSYEDGTLVLGLTASKAFAKSIIEAPQNLQTISDVVGQALGGSPGVRFVVLGAEHADDAPEVAAAPAAQVTEDELVSRLTEEFDAHEV
ncbi:MAG TPA: DNA polymerase III subunit gamma/tau [Gaiellales bacterium]|nr:DNA polymerase III subunit gamma/tau [Gaiellales bacterium]